MSLFAKTLRSSIGRKFVMALTGIGLLGFVIAHMLGNLQVFLGADKLNAYAKGLQDLGGVLWIARIGLLVMFAVHVITAFQLWSENRAARGPQGYAVQAYETATYASRTMMWSGIIVAAFIAYHLAHFTFHWTDPPSFHRLDAMGRSDVYRMVILGFRQPLVSILYVVAQVLLGLHISHGASSLFQSLGMTSPRVEPLKKSAGPLLAIVIVLGNCAIPLAVLFGLVGKDVQ